MDVQINSRIKEIMEHAKLTPSDFSAAIGITRSNLSHILSGRNQPSFSMLEKILKAFPEIRTEWLITGLGDMLRDEVELAETVAAIEQNPLPHTQFEMNFDEDVEVSAPTAKPSTEVALAKQPELPDVESNAAVDVDFSPVDESSENLPEDEPSVQNTVNPLPVAASRPISRQNSPQKTRVQRTEVRQQPKKVKKIVYFYTDNSFEEYFPC